MHAALTFDVVLAGPGGLLSGPDEFFAQASAAAASLSGAGPIVNLCEDRRKFLVVFAAAMMRHRTVLLPPSRAPAAVSELCAGYPGCEIVDDSLAAAGGKAGTCLPGEDEHDFIAAIGHTSGSTGVPVAHEKSFQSLAATTALNARVLRTGLARQLAAGRPWIVATVPPQHMYGLEMSVLLPLLAGFGIHGGKPLLPADVAAVLAEVPAPRVLVSTPAHLRALVESSADFPPISIVVSATAPLDTDLALRIEKRLDAVLVEFFGSTETCVIASRRPAREDMWRPYPGIELAVAAGGTTVRAPWLAGSQLLHDVMEMREDGSFRIVGRGSDIIEVGGKRASLADLTRRLLSVEGVDDAVVFQPPVKDGGVAGRCAALVVAPGMTAREVGRRMRGLVDAVFVPRPIVMMKGLPRNEVGKLPRERLLEALATSASRLPRGR